MEDYSFICEEDSSSLTDYESDSIRNDNYIKRHISSMEESPKMKKAKCLSKNALMARENRRKKKLYLENIEREVQYLREVNRQLKHKHKINIKEIASLKKEVTYLKNVFANNSSITKLLNCINQSLKPKVIVKTEPIATSVMNTFSEDPLLSGTSSLNTLNEIHQEGTEIIPQVGICLHLSNDQLTLGLCPLCNNSAMDGGLFF